MSKDLAKDIDTLCNNIENLVPDINWMVEEIKRLRAENLELQLKVDNLLFYIRKLTQAQASTGIAMEHQDWCIGRKQ